MLFREVGGETYGFILTDTTDFYSSRDTREADNIFIAEDNYVNFLELVKSAEIN